MRKSKLLSLLLSLSLSSGCGYRWQPDYPGSERPTISIGFIKGDEDGSFTAEVIRALGASGLVDVVSTGGNYSVEVEVKAQNNENIDFRRDPQKVDGKVRKNLLAVEGRRSMAIEVSFLKGEKVAFGPYLLEADADYDFVDGDSVQDLTFIDSNGKLITVLPFSLGQLEPLESAQEAATKPLYRRLAQKIVDVLSSNW